MRMKPQVEGSVLRCDYCGFSAFSAYAPEQFRTDEDGSKVRQYYAWCQDRQACSARRFEVSAGDGGPVTVFAVVRKRSE